MGDREKNQAFAPRVGLEPTTIALTGRRSTIELPRNGICSHEQIDYNILRMERKELIRTIYLYLFSLVGLVIVVIGLVNLVDLGLKTFVFKNADQPIRYPSYPYPAKILSPDGQEPAMTAEEQAKFEADQAEAEKKQRQSERERSASQALAMIIIGTPLFIYHWKTIQSEKKRD